MCDSGPKGNSRRGWTSGSLNLPESLLRGPCSASWAGLPRLRLLPHLVAFVNFSELMLKFVFIPGKQRRTSFFADIGNIYL